MKDCITRYGCDQSYNDRSNRRQHEKRAHGIVGPREAEKEELERKLSKKESFHQTESFDQTESCQPKALQIYPDLPTFLQDPKSAGNASFPVYETQIHLQMKAQKTLISVEELTGCLGMDVIGVTTS